MNEAGEYNCLEICGDGLNFRQYDCDDGNLVNGDGCSSVCKVEPGFYCEGGSPVTSDVCELILETGTLEDC